MTVFTSDGTFIPEAPNKDPDSVIDYGADWALWLASGETIITSTWVIPTGLVSDSETSTTTATAVFLSGGTIGESYTVTNRIVTSAGRTEDRSMIILCAQK